MEEKESELMTDQLNSNNNEKKDSQNIDEEKIIEPSLKKKFANTVFAEKMRQRKLEEKLKRIDSEQILKSCKPVSVKVSRLPSDLISKISKSREHKKKRKKKYQWQLGVIKKIKRNSESVKHIDNSFMNETRHYSSASSDNGSYMVTAGIESFNEEKCRRVLPFVGKLNTKEARNSYIEHLCQSEISSKKDPDILNKSYKSSKAPSQESVSNESSSNNSRKKDNS